MTVLSSTLFVSPSLDSAVDQHAVSALACSNCQSEVYFLPEKLLCKSCQHQLPVQDNNLIFTVNTSTYRDHIPEPLIDQYLKHCSDYGWGRSFYELQRSIIGGRSELFSSSLAKVSAAWRIMCPQVDRGQALMFGASHSVVCMEQARAFSQVIVVDSNIKRLYSVLEQANYFGLKNIVCILANSIDKLPLRDSSLDLISIPDLQDYLIQLGETKGRVIPEPVFDYIKRWLSTRGVLYVAGNNRFTFSGITHKKRPRKSSSSSSSYRGYQRRISAAGIKTYGLFAPIPDHRMTAEYVNLSADTTSGNLVELGVGSALRSRVKANPVFLRSFGHTFAMFGGVAERPRPSLILRLMDYAQSKLKLELGSFREVFTSDLESTVKIETKLGDLFIRIPHSRRGVTLLQQNNQALRMLSDILAENQIRRLLPRQVLTGELEGYYFSVERRKRGVSAEDYVANVAQPGFIESILPILSDLGSISGNQESARLAKTAFKAAAVTGSSAIVDRMLRRNLTKWVSKIAQSVEKHQWSYSMCHGDLRLSSFSVNEETGEVTSIGNWSHASRSGLPGWDLVAVQASCLTIWKNSSFGESIVDLLTRGPAPAFTKPWSELIARDQLSNDMLNALILSYWVKSLSYKFVDRFAGLDYEWISRNVIPVLEVLEQQQIKLSE